MSCQLPLLALFQDIRAVKRLLFPEHNSGENEVTEGDEGRCSRFDKIETLDSQTDYFLSCIVELKCL